MLHWLSSCSGKRKLIEVTELNKLQWTSSSVPKPEGAAVGNYLIQYALALVLKESFKIYCAVNDGIINLIDKVTIDVASPEAGIIQEFIAKEGDTVEPGTKIAIISKSAEGAAAPPKNGPYMWNPQWCSAVKRISQGTPPLVVSLVKWLEDELELNALHNPGSRRLSGNEKAAASQRSALSAALGGRVDVNTTSVLVTTVSLYDMY